MQLDVGSEPTSRFAPVTCTASKTQFRSSIFWPKVFHWGQKMLVRIVLLKKANKCITLLRNLKNAT